MKIQTNSRVSQIGRAFFTQNFRNRRTGFASLVFNEIHNNFQFSQSFFSKKF